MTHARHHRCRLLPVIVAAASALPAAPAAAHIQVRPAQAAPGDPVLWTVLVPSEDEAGTREVELAVPKDVLPFSYEDAPGWARQLRINSDGSVRSIVWRGRTGPDGLATFRFLASTPEREGSIAWKAIQTYRDGAKVRWIGAADSEHPASITTVSSSVARENAGGEAGTDAGAGAGAQQATPTQEGPASGEDGGGPDWLARGLGAVALLGAAAAALVSLRRRPTSP